MAKVNIKGIPAIERKYRDTFKKVRSSKPMLNEVGRFTVQTLQFQARRRQPLNDTGEFPDIQESTKRRRKSDAKYNKTHPAFSANRSNLTFSGQLIDAIIYLVQTSSVVIDVANRIRSPRVDKNGRPIDAGETNKDVDRDLRRRGFILYTKKGIEASQRYSARVNNILKTYVRRAIKANFGS
jgi:hypothetical protein